MKAMLGNMFDYIGRVDAICITTNGFVKANGLAVMGAGCAKVARDTFTGIDARLGKKIRIKGNTVHQLGIKEGTAIMSLPVKHNWWEAADLELIAKSCKELVTHVDQQQWKHIILPKPGCGNGKLSWAEVYPVISKILDDRFYVIDYKKKERPAVEVELDEHEVGEVCTDTRDRYKDKENTSQPDRDKPHFNIQGIKYYYAEVQAVCPSWKSYSCPDKGKCHRCKGVHEYTDSLDEALREMEVLSTQEQRVVNHDISDVKAKDEFTEYLRKVKAEVESLTVKQLKELAKDYSIKKYSTMKKAELVKVISIEIANTKSLKQLYLYKINQSMK